MKKIFNILITIFIATMSLMMVSSASEGSIVLNAPVTDDVAHTFKYPNLEIDNNVKPYSITLSIENGYFMTNDADLNSTVETYFNFMGGTNLSNAYIETLNITEKFKLITFNLLDTVDLTDSTTKENVIASIKDFVRNIIFYNNENKDAKFTLTFSEIELTLDSPDNLLEGINIVAFKDPEQPKEHYYARIDDDGILWSEAYKVASQLQFNGLQGYLVTITSEAEHNFIYQSLGSIRAWMGAASILNAEDITYNTNDIAWQPATNELAHSKSFGYSTQNDDNIKLYWRWAAGPEAGNKVFEEGAYTNFKAGEPNNYSTGEWCGEYGHDAGGVWNDYPDYASDIQGYYIEFGGFPDETMETEPVSLVSTFKWTDYDIRNIEQKIEEELEDSELKDAVPEEEIKKIIDDAIEETGLTETTYEIANKKINNNILTFDIEVTLGTSPNETKYTIPVEREIENDYETVKETIEEEFENKELYDDVTDEDLEEIVANILKETGKKDTTNTINNKEIKDNVISFDVEIIFNNSDGEIKYTIHIDKEVKEYTYKFLSGDNQELTINDISEYTFTIDGAYSLFESVKIGDLELIKDEDYIVTEGSTIITFTKNGIAKLNAILKGEYEILVSYSNKKTVTGKVVLNQTEPPEVDPPVEEPPTNDLPDNPQTIDNILTYLILLSVSILGLISGYIINKITKEFN